MSIDGLRNLFLIPEWLMALSLISTAITCFVRWRWKITKEGIPGMVLTGILFGNMGMLYFLIFLSGDRTGLGWILRLWLFTGALVFFLFNVKAIWEYKSLWNLPSLQHWLRQARRS